MQRKRNTMDDIDNLLDRLSIKQKNTNINKIIYFDALNYANIFFDFNDHWNIEYTENRTKEFLKCVKKSGYELKVIIDGIASSKEAIKKWEYRREEEVKNGNKITCMSMNILMGDIFTDLGVEVHYSKIADCDDIIAAMAHANKAFVLSRDGDFLRYIEREYTIFNHFKTNSDGILEFDTPNFTTPREGVSYRQILSPIPKTCQSFKEFLLNIQGGQYIYLRGCSSSLIKSYGNAHIEIKKLRAALYHFMGIKEKVREIFPNWNLDKNEFEWYTEITESDASLEKLLFKPDEAYEFFFGKVSKPHKVSAEKWNNHIFNLHIVIYEMCSIAMEVPLISLLKGSMIYLSRKKKDFRSIPFEISTKIFYKNPAFISDCKECRKKFTLSENELKYFEKKGLTMPKRCNDCRKNNSYKK